MDKDEILVISDDSTDNIIQPTQKSNYSLSDSSDDELLRPVKLKSDDFGATSSVSEDEALIQRLKEKYNIGSKPEVKPKCSKLPTTTKPNSKQERESKRQEKLAKREQIQKEKELRNAQKAIERYIKPDECLKLVTVNIDANLIQEDYGSKILETLQSNTIHYNILNQRLTNLITYTRKSQSIDNGVLKTSFIEEKHGVLVMDLHTFLPHIQENSLSNLFNDKQTTVIVYKLQSYLKHVKNLKNRQLKETLRSPVKKSIKEFNDMPIVSAEAIRNAQVELQLLRQIYFRTAETPDEVVNIIVECTKAVGQIPFKQKKLEKYENESEYFAGVNKNCVQIDKNGNGLGELWKQALTMFPLARLETAEAIASVYQSPKALFQAYERCKDQKLGENLLENIPVRRTAGPLANSRHIGPELSKKMYNFFCSFENKAI